MEKKKLAYLYLVKPSSVAEFDAVCRQLEEKPAVHITQVTKDTWCCLLDCCDFFGRQVSLVSETFSVSTAAPIAYQMRVLEVIGGAEQKGSGL